MVGPGGPVWRINSTVPWAVDGRIGVGHAGDGGEPAGHGRGRAGLDRLVVLEARLAEMDVHVDQPRRDDLARGIDHGLLAVVGSAS